MSDAFDKFKSSVNRGIATISVKTSSTLEKSKIKTHIESIHREIEREFSCAGQAAYQIWESGQTDFAALQDMFAAIKRQYQEIADLNAQLASIDDKNQQILGGGSPQAPAEPPTPRYVCTNCGAQYDVPVNFCRKCGNKINA